MVKNKTFRKDLYFRLKKIVLEIPPLRERKDDIPVLIDFFLKKHTRNGKIKKMPSSIVQLLMEHSWPGNVRELENTKEVKGINIFFEKDCGLDAATRIMEKKIIINVINNSSTKEIAAQKLGINRKTLYKQIQLYEISE